MSLHLQRDLDQLRKDLLQLGSMVEMAFTNAMLVLHEQRLDVVQKVFEDEKQIDEKEVLIEESCLKILALHQPVAVDLRFIVVALKVNNDLERMGDFAVNIVKRAVTLAKLPALSTPHDFVVKMPEIIRAMINGSLDALVKLDVGLAKKIIEMDDAVDDINREMYDTLRRQMENDTQTVERAIEFLSTSRYMERIADLSTNIAEDVIFLVDGEVVRHQTI
ncbi:MAG: phosphate transport system protein [Gammaproteobacteria bacterium]|jgi:phosphate transport system protein